VAAAEGKRGGRENWGWEGGGVLYEGNLTRVSPIHSTVLREFNGQSGGERRPGGVGETNFLLKKDQLN
jgi:hypothetical protein